jgi:starch synthase
MEKKKILYISQEISPFLPKSEISATARKLPQVIQEAGKEIRVFMPRFGVINERRHQLHEVIRLSGLNICIDDQDHPLNQSGFCFRG